MSMKLTTALASRCSLPSYPIGTFSSERGWPSPSQPALHMGQPLGRSTCQTEKHSVSAFSALIGQHCGELVVTEGRNTGRSLACLRKVC